ncbi:Post-transcriptional regulator ComN [Lysinibacillus sphaericus]|uniref:Post-transcriptional regulator ComN n=1 Tax=Lysinibacillus sphaericus TaxID=1421 RepID=A0A2S5CXI3_LYSSH|nr:post-transcriptional regulator [Lysinibacillus sphaericus]POZ55543.1 Post-transcriptional regulator ComN [Lysinibacillus sphaericus]
MSMQHAQLFEKIRPAIDSKIAEFKYYKYDAISAEELWRYCVEKKWRKKNVEQLRLYEVIATIFAVSPSDIVSFNQVEFLQSDDWFAEINTEELKSLLGPLKTQEEYVVFVKD